MFRLLTISRLILLNQYVQGIVKREEVVLWYSCLDENDKQSAVKEVWMLATQAHVIEDDVLAATAEADLKPTHAPVQILKTCKMPFHRRGYELATLKGTSLNHAFLLALECFALAERRRKEQEEPQKCNHWWHRDLADENIIRDILNNNL